MDNDLQVVQINVLGFAADRHPCGGESVVDAAQIVVLVISVVIFVSVVILGIRNQVTKLQQRTRRFLVLSLQSVACSGQQVRMRKLRSGRRGCVACRLLVGRLPFLAVALLLGNKVQHGL